MKKQILFLILSKVLRVRHGRNPREKKNLLWLLGFATAGTLVGGLFLTWLAISALGKVFDIARSNAVNLPSAITIPSMVSDWGARPLIRPGCLQFAQTLVNSPRLLTSPLRETWSEGAAACRMDRKGTEPAPEREESASIPNPKPREAG